MIAVNNILSFPYRPAFNPLLLSSSFGLVGCDMNEIDLKEEVP